MKITICGGGSLGHVCMGVLSNQEGVEVSLLTNHPERWNRQLTVTDINGKVFQGTLAKVSSSPEDVIPDADIVFLCLPGFLIKQTLEQIKPFVNSHAVIGSIVSSTGFFFFAHEVFGEKARTFGFQRVPFIARVVEYGKTANLLGYKPAVAIACENIEDVEGFRATVERLFITKTTLLGNFYEASLTNSNPILHTGRLYSMWHDWNGEPYDRSILFYKEWDTESSEWLIRMDNEFMNLLEVLPMNKSCIPSLLDYYESHDAESLAAKLRSINAFKTIQAPMFQDEKGMWFPDFSSRYFTEDFPFGLKLIVDLARKYNVETPNIDIVYQWGMKKVMEC